MRKKMEQEIQITEKDLEKVLKSGGSKSSMMKQLFDLGLEVKEIARIMGVRYNFVYNVISNYCNMNGIETVSNQRGGKKEQIIALYEQGKTNKEISIELKTNYNYVFSVIKEYKMQKEMEGKKEEA